MTDAERVVEGVTVKCRDCGDAGCALRGNEDRGKRWIRRDWNSSNRGRHLEE